MDAGKSYSRSGGTKPNSSSVDVVKGRKSGSKIGTSDPREAVGDGVNLGESELLGSQPDQIQYISSDSENEELSKRNGEDSDSEMETKSTSTDDDFRAYISSKSIHSNKEKKKAENEMEIETEEDKRNGAKGKRKAIDVTPRNDDRIVRGRRGMKRVPGLNIWESNDCPQVSTKMADRLRSSRRKTNERKNNESRTSCVTPTTLSSDEQENGASSDDEKEGNDSQDDEQVNGISSDDHQEEETREGMHQIPLREGYNAIDKTTLEKILLDSLSGKMDLPSPFPCQEQVYPELPKNFSLEDYDAEPPEEKSYWDIEGEKLFEEMEFAKATEEIGSTHSNIVVDDQTPVDNEDVGMLRSCEHDLFLDEQIGLICIHCSHVEVEIRYVPPTFAANPWKRTSKKEFREKRHKNIDMDQLGQMNFGNGQSHPNADAFDTAGTVWDLIPGMKRTMYSHQRDGFEFIWNNLEGSILLEDLKKETSNDGNGCIISHAPGTGKTRLTIMFIKSYLELYPTAKIVIIAPCNMLLTWEEEFKKWKVNIPFHNLNRKEFSGEEAHAAVNLVKQLHEQDKNTNRLVKLFSWKKDKSVLGMSYGLYEKLAGDGGNKNKSSEKQVDGSQIMKILPELPDLLVLDEGHTPRNENSHIWNALIRIKTQRRIILSGTPFQNNFRELYNTLYLVRPKFAEKFITKKTHAIPAKRKRDSKEDVSLNKWVSLSKGVVENDDDRIEEMRDIICRIAHVYKGDILKDMLPGLRDSLVVLKPTELQNTILNVILKMKNGLEREHCVSLTSVHPSLLIQSQLSGKEELSVYMSQLDGLKLNPEVGVKTKFIIELIRLSKSLNEKVLIFSQYIQPLTLIQDQIKSYFGWSEGKELLYMDGAKNLKMRQLSIASFNNSESAVKVMLASTKACSEGISLVGASRVVLLDVVWNPSVERQAISRAYRLGQEKLVYIYHLVAGEAETTKYGRQTQKDRLSNLVFSSNNNLQDASQKRPLMGIVGEDKILQEMVQHEKTCHMFEKIINQEKESNFY